ncbi:ATP-binding cassette domain-containing protein [Oligella urethralis]|uniref:ATP-binding cassette domain-containing protein n=1 Tax=Oligella urethralis TaxID=90245 RepID=UPI00215F9D79|nr:ATP-binding cassette domain-containing protein [Oligella urethralis]
MFNSLDAANLSLKNRHQWVSYMPQKLNLISGTIEENLNILEPNIEPSKILDMLRRLNFEHNTNTPVSQLSGGERQRLLLVLSLLRGTPIILLDEPTSALNKELSILTMKIIKEHVERHNNTVLLVTHDEEVASLADKVYKLDGQIIL